MRMNRLMFVGLLALIAAVGMLGVNGYSWWLSQSRESGSLHNLTSSPPGASSNANRVEASPQSPWDDSENWETAHRELYRDLEDPTPTLEYFPHHLEMAQADVSAPKPDHSEKNSPAKPAPPPLLLPDVAAPINQAPVEDWLSELVRRELPHAAPEERRVWSQELQGLGPEMARDILRMRKSVMAAPSLPRVDARADNAPAWPPVPEPPTPLTEKLVPPPVDDLDGENRSLANRLQPSFSALEQARDVILNNLANAHTPGFKRLRVVFTTRPYQTLKEINSPQNSEAGDAPAVAVGWGVELGCTLLDVSQGPLKKTNQPLDVAIEGLGFFQVRVGEEVLYTRCGIWTLNEDGELCVINGDKLCRIEPPLTVPENSQSLVIGEEGQISSLIPDKEKPSHLGQMALVRFLNPSALMPRGGQMYAATKASGRPVTGRPGVNGFGRVWQGQLELSNVSRDEELEQFQFLQTHLQLLKQLAGTPRSFSVPGPVARRPGVRAKRAAVETVPVPSPPWESFKELRNQGNNLIEEYLQSERVQSIKRTLGLR